jgi:hypothetical protein
MVGGEKRIIVISMINEENQTVTAKSGIYGIPGILGVWRSREKDAFFFG